MKTHYPDYQKKVEASPKVKIVAAPAKIMLFSGMIMSLTAAVSDDSGYFFQRTKEAKTISTVSAAAEEIRIENGPNLKISALVNQQETEAFVLTGDNKVYKTSVQSVPVTADKQYSVIVWTEKDKKLYLKTVSGKCDWQKKQQVKIVLDKVNILKPEIFPIFEKALQGDVPSQTRLGYCYLDGDGVDRSMEEAVKWFQHAADKGDSEALLSLGMCAYLKSRVTGEDNSKAISMIKKAAELGNAKAQTVLAVFYAETDDLEKAFEWYLKAAEQGSPDAMCEVGKYYREGYGVKKNPEEGVRWLLKSAEKGNDEAARQLGYCYKNGAGVKKDLAEAFKWFIKSAEQGNAQAQFNVAVLYSLGKGVKEDPEESFKWMLKSAEQDYYPAQTLLALSYENGIGTEKNLIEAAKWYHTAAQKGNPEVQFTFGKFLMNAPGIAGNPEEGVKWFRKAAEQGHVEAQIELGLCLLYEKGTARNPEEAVKWLLKAADKNNGRAQALVGVCYEFGFGVEKNLDTAREWLQKAVANGHANAQKRLDDLKR